MNERMTYVPQVVSKTIPSHTRFLPTCNRTREVMRLKMRLGDEPLW